MAMDKYSQDDELLLDGLRNEEATLMQQMQRFMTGGEKTAAETAQMQSTETRLQQVRGKITALDQERAKKQRGGG